MMYPLLLFFFKNYIRNSFEVLPDFVVNLPLQDFGLPLEGGVETLLSPCEDLITFQRETFTAILGLSAAEITAGVPAVLNEEDGLHSTLFCA